MAKTKTQCSCGETHEFEGDNAKRFNGKIPEYIECSECPECSPELLETPDDHEDEAYTEDIDVDKLKTDLFDDVVDDLDIDTDDDEL